VLSNEKNNLTPMYIYQCPCGECVFYLVLKSAENAATTIGPIGSQWFSSWNSCICYVGVAFLLICHLSEGMCFMLLEYVYLLIEQVFVLCNVAILGWWTVSWLQILLVWGSTLVMGIVALYTGLLFWDKYMRQNEWCFTTNELPWAEWFPGISGHFPLHMTVLGI
jgi:hypothetical protein